MLAGYVLPAFKRISLIDHAHESPIVVAVPGLQAPAGDEEVDVCRVIGHDRACFVINARACRHVAEEGLDSTLAVFPDDFLYHSLVILE